MTTATHPNGCHNRPAFRTFLPMQDGWWMDGQTRTAKMVSVPFRLSTDCQYTRDPMGLGQKDPRCEGCRWRADAGQEVTK